MADIDNYSHSQEEDDYLDEEDIIQNGIKHRNTRNSKREAVSAEVIDSICKPTTVFAEKSEEQ